MTALPAVIVAGDVGSSLRAMAGNSGGDVLLRLCGRLEDNVSAYNVMGRIERGPRWIVVSTPYSGWFTCGGERGAGIAIWRALARWAGGAESKDSFLFVANSGH